MTVKFNSNVSVTKTDCVKCDHNNRECAVDKRVLNRLRRAELACGLLLLAVVSTWVFMWYFVNNGMYNHTEDQMRKHILEICQQSQFDKKETSLRKPIAQENYMEHMTQTMDGTHEHHRTKRDTLSSDDLYHILERRAAAMRNKRMKKKCEDGLDSRKCRKGMWKKMGRLNEKIKKLRVKRKSVTSDTSPHYSALRSSATTPEPEVARLVSHFKAHLPSGVPKDCSLKHKKQTYCPGNRTFITASDYTRMSFFEKAAWVDDKNPALKMESGGKFRAKQSGIFMLYSLVTYNDNREKQGYWIKVNGVDRIARCMQTQNSSERRHQSCSLTLTTKLNVNDYIVLENLYPGANISLDYDCTYLGAVLLHVTR